MIIHKFNKFMLHSIIADSRQMRLSDGVRNITGGTIGSNDIHAGM